MGGRGSYSYETQSIKTREFTRIGFVPGYNGHKPVKVLLQDDTTAMAKTTTYSNTPDTIYVTLDPQNGMPDHIYYFEGHYLKRSVDLQEKGGPHYHFWKEKDGKVGRKSHDKNNTFTNLTPEDLHYIRESTKLAIEKHDEFLRRKRENEKKR